MDHLSASNTCMLLSLLHASTHVASGLHLQPNK
jgi:hypothetical protein